MGLKDKFINWISPPSKPVDPIVEQRLQEVIDETEKARRLKEQTQREREIQLRRIRALAAVRGAPEVRKENRQ